MAKHEGKADGEEQETAQTRIDDTFHQDVHRFSRTTESCFEQREANLHSEDQESAQQYPKSVDGIDYVAGLDVAVGCEAGPTQQFGTQEQNRHYQADAGELAYEQ